jgi:hypothetical protein
MTFLGKLFVQTKFLNGVFFICNNCLQGHFSRETLWKAAIYAGTQTSHRLPVLEDCTDRQEGSTPNLTLVDSGAFETYTQLRYRHHSFHNLCY